MFFLMGVCIDFVRSEQMASRLLSCSKAYRQVRVAGVVTFFR